MGSSGDDRGTTRRDTALSELTSAVEVSFAQCQDARLKLIMQSLVRYLHAFATDVRLTEREWQQGIDTLTTTGEVTSGERQEFVLWSDVLGLSMLVDALAHPKPEHATESTVRGPFWVDGSPELEYGDPIFDTAAGEPAWVHGRVTDIDGAPVVGALLDVWQNDANRLYGIQDDSAPEAHLRGKFRTTDDGRYAFLGVRPVAYPIPSDGPVGAMLAATARHPWRPAHLHMIISAAGYETLTTHIFDAESPYLASDAVFAVKPSLLRRFVHRVADDPERPPQVLGDWWSVANNIVLTPRRDRG